MDAGGWGCGDEVVDALTSCVRLLEDLPVSASRLGGGELSAVLAVVDRVAAVAAAGRFTLASEAEQRGDVASSTAGTMRTWLTERCPYLEAREVGTLAKAVLQLNTLALEAPCPCGEWRGRSALTERRGVAPTPEGAAPRSR